MAVSWGRFFTLPQLFKPSTPTPVGPPAPPQPTASLPALPAERDAYIHPSLLSPHVKYYAQKYGVDPAVMGAIIEQESSYINHGVHQDGFGHGLIGLDDRGLLADFEAWTHTECGRGRDCVTLPPEKQIEFLALRLSAFSKRFGGDQWQAARAWHAGSGGREAPHAHEYETKLRGRLTSVNAWLDPARATGWSPVNKGTSGNGGWLAAADSKKQV